MRRSGRRSRKVVSDMAFIPAHSTVHPYLINRVFRFSASVHLTMTNCAVFGKRAASKKRALRKWVHVIVANCDAKAVARWMPQTSAVWRRGSFLGFGGGVQPFQKGGFLLGVGVGEQLAEDFKL